MSNRRRLIGLVGLVIAAAAGCGDTPRGRLQADLVAEYGSEAAPTVGFTGGDSTHLFLLFEGPPFKPLPDSLVAGKQREVARFALSRYQGAALLDSITVVFNEHEGVVGTRPEHTASGRFAVSSLR